MEGLKNYFSSEHDWHRIVLLFSCMFIFWNIENLLALNFNYKKWKHAFTNSLFIFTDAPVQFVFGLLLLKAINFDSQHHIGILNWVKGLQNPWIEVIFTFLALDFFEYVYHRLMHFTKPLWMFHVVHHSDRVVDTSTVLREHPGETSVRLAMSVLWVLLLGASFWVILFRQFVQIIFNVFAHSNFRLSEKADRVIGLLFITPNLHHVHHHYKQPYTDTNYGDIFSIWDRMFGTFQRLNKEEVVFGIDTYMADEENAVFSNLVIMPFGEYRPTGNEDVQDHLEPSLISIKS